MKEFLTTNISLEIDKVKLEVSAISRKGSKPPIVFLHGFGSTKEDYADIIRQAKLNDYPFIAYDAPGCGATICNAPEKVSIPFLVKTAIAVLDFFTIEKFHLVGHSMGGLTSLMLANEFPNRVLSFTDIEGNIAPEDCFLSRQIVDFASDSADEFFAMFIDRTMHSSAYSSPLYASTLKKKVRAAAVPAIFTSMVDLSDNANLMDKFLNLPCPKMFMYGEQNKSLSYLKYIEKNGVRLAQVPECGHFPMYSNPPFMWQALSHFITQTDE